MQLLDYKGVAEKLAIHPRAVYGLASSDPSFPAAVTLAGVRRTRWVEEEIDQWITNNRRNKNDHSD